MNYSKNFIIRFTSKQDQHFGRYFRKIVSAKNLCKYIGETNAINALQTIKIFKAINLPYDIESSGELKYG